MKEIAIQHTFTITEIKDWLIKWIDIVKYGMKSVYTKGVTLKDIPFLYFLSYMKEWYKVNDYIGLIFNNIGYYDLFNSHSKEFKTFELLYNEIVQERKGE